MGWGDGGGPHDWRQILPFLGARARVMLRKEDVWRKGCFITWSPTACKPIRNPGDENVNSRSKHHTEIVISKIQGLPYKMEQASLEKVGISCRQRGYRLQREERALLLGFCNIEVVLGSWLVSWDTFERHSPFWTAHSSLGEAANSSFLATYWRPAETSFSLSPEMVLALASHSGARVSWACQPQRVQVFNHLSTDPPHLRFQLQVKLGC